MPEKSKKYGACCVKIWQFGECSIFAGKACRRLLGFDITYLSYQFQTRIKALKKEKKKNRKVKKKALWARTTRDQKAKREEMQKNGKWIFELVQVSPNSFLAGRTHNPDISTAGFVRMGTLSHKRKFFSSPPPTCVGGINANPEIFLGGYEDPI